MGVTYARSMAFFIGIFPKEKKTVCTMALLLLLLTQRVNHKADANPSLFYYGMERHEKTERHAARVFDK